ncbi:MAG: hypothetical protein N2Z80_03840 [Hydrogenothermaceae bacterium]|nr:hypothetical protein [Hydrogenothermaceae bacterium]
MIDILKKAKVYIDFGNHTGKDRIPREAAMLECCVITGRRGIAKYREDVPIPENYKIEDKVENIPLILSKKYETVLITLRKGLQTLKIIEVL